LDVVYLDGLCEDAYRSLSRVILEQIGQIEQIETSRKAPVSQGQPSPDDSFLNSRVEGARADEQLFPGIAAVQQEIAHYLAKPATLPLALCAEHGAGKSALIARAVEKAREDHPLAHVAVRFVGAAPNSCDLNSVLVGLCIEIGSWYGEKNSRIPPEEQGLVLEFQRRLRLAAEKASVILFLEGLEQLSGSHAASTLNGLLMDLPPHAHLVVSTLASEWQVCIEARLPQANRVYLRECRAIPREHVAELLEQSLRSAGRTLQDAQRAEVVGKIEACTNPLYARMYVKFAFEEARQWRSYDGIPEYNGKKGFASDVGSLFSDFLWRLSRAGKHDEVLVSRCLGYLAVARNGLAEDELLEVLSEDVDVYERFFRASLHCPPDLEAWVRKRLHGAPPADAAITGQTAASDVSAVAAELTALRKDSRRLRAFLGDILSEPDGPHLPLIIWSRLYFDLAPYLSERVVEGTALLNFFHREFYEVVSEEHLSPAERTELDRRLADYSYRKLNPSAGKASKNSGDI
jgi:hypothetical protein